MILEARAPVVVHRPAPRATGRPCRSAGLLLGAALLATLVAAPARCAARPTGGASAVTSMRAPAPPAPLARLVASPGPVATMQAPGAMQAPAPTPASELRGVVLDSAGKPVPDQHIQLHRVNQTGGALVDSAVTDRRGRFTVKVPAESDTSAVFFVATRWQGQLYIGTAFRPPAPAGTPYTVTVGVNPVELGPVPGEAGGGATAPMGAGPAGVSGPSGAGRWFLVAMLALVALGAIAYALVGSARERAARRQRALLARIAELDARAAAASGDEATRLRRERAELLSQLVD